MNRSRILQFLLLGLALMLTIALFMGVKESPQVRLSTRPANPSESQQSAIQATSASTVMVKPRYTGSDETGNRWEVTADAANQSGTMASSTLNLSNVAASWEQPPTTTSASAFALSAQQGEYIADAKTLALAGDVSASGPNFQLNAPAATANLSSRNVSGNQGVTLTGTLGSTPGTVTANNFTVDAQSHKVLLTGNVKVVLKRNP